MEDYWEIACRCASMAYRMTPLPAMLSDLEGHFRCLRSFYLTYLRKYIVYYLRYVYPHVACNFNYLFENQVLLKIPASQVHCKCGNISETVPDRVFVATDY